MSDNPRGEYEHSFGQDFGRLLTASGALRIDSPLSNLAFYKDITTDGLVVNADGVVVFSALNPDGTVNPTLLAAYQSIFLGGASYKTKEVTADVVHAVDIIMAFEEPTPKGVTPVNEDVAQDDYLATYARHLQGSDRGRA